MSEYIEVDAFKREMYHEAFETDTDMQRWDSGCWIRYKLFEEILKKQPTADVRENVHGKWVNGYCDQCGGHAPFWAMASTYYKSDFCPKCGADMRKGETNG